MKSLREITYEYAQARGGGLPLTAEELCNCVVQWVQQYTQEQISASGETLNKIRTATYEAIAGQLPIIVRRKEAPEGDYNLIGMDIELDIQELFQKIEAIYLIDYFEGSDTVVVDLNEAGDKIEIHLDGDIIAMLNRAILQPVNPVAEDSVPVVSPNQDVTYKPLSEIGGGGCLFRISGPNGTFNINLPVEVPSSYVGLQNFLFTNNINDENSSFIPCSGKTSAGYVAFACALDNLSNQNIIMKTVRIIDGSLNITNINVGVIGSFTCTKLT